MAGAAQAQANLVFNPMSASAEATSRAFFIQTGTSAMSLSCRLTVGVEPKAGRVTVTDSGPGIPEDRRELVFQPFFTTKKQKEGRGLGLYIAREIAEYHGGTLTLGDADKNGMIHSVVLVLGEVQGE
jgi:signal transduction histidine kinase